MTFFTSTLQGRGYGGTKSAFLFAIPYAVAAVIMILNSRHSDKTQERRGHVAVVYFVSGATLILSVSLKDQFWLSYGLMCLAIQGPFAGQAPFWAIPSETLPRSVMGSVMGLVNAFGNVGGFAGQYLVGWMKDEYHSIAIPFATLGAGMILAAFLCFLLPRRPLDARTEG
jgi:ACS family tartrate transporter-like MFS transporter